MTLKLFVDPSANLSQKCILSPGNAAALGVSNGGYVRVTDESTGKSTNCALEVSNEVLDFSVKVAIDVITAINFNGLELKIDAASGPAPAQPSRQAPVQQPRYSPTPSIPQSDPFASSPMPAPSYMPPAPRPSYTPPAPAPVYTPPAPMPSMSPPGMSMPSMSPPGMSMPSMSPPGMSMPSMSPPGMSMPSMSPPGMSAPGMVPPGGMGGMSPGPGMGDMGMAPAPVPVDPYPNRIDANVLAGQKPGSLVLRPAVSSLSLEGKIILNSTNILKMGIFPNAMVGWEDPLTRATGSARVKEGQANEFEIMIDSNTKSDTNVQADKLVVYSMEPPVVHVDVVSLEVEARPELNGYIQINYRNAKALGVNQNDILAFEDELTGAFGAAKVSFNENTPDQKIVVDQELLEASGVGSFSVNLKKNVRQIVPLQSLDLGVSPITGEKVWEVITFARTNIGSIKQWLGNYIIYKGIKLRWKTANTAIEVIHTVPDLTGDVLASVTANTTITLKPTGLVTFNAILILDISRSMMAKDVEVTNIGPALEGIKAAMNDPEIQEFLKKFKPNIQVPRRMAAAFAAILFLAEKVGRGFGEKVSIIRFADEAQVLTMPDGKLWMDSSSGQKGVLEATAKKIVNEIGNAYGQATNMGPAMIKATEILQKFTIERPDQPTMIVILTDGVPTDGDAFFQNIHKLSANPNIVLYIIGLGNPDDEAMKKAAQLCGGEYFKPKDSGELLVWYSKRARDLQVKLKKTS